MGAAALSRQAASRAGRREQGHALRRTGSRRAGRRRPTKALTNALCPRRTKSPEPDETGKIKPKKEESSGATRRRFRRQDGQAAQNVRGNERQRRAERDAGVGGSNKKRDRMRGVRHDVRRVRLLAPGAEERGASGRRDRLTAAACAAGTRGAVAGNLMDGDFGRTGRRGKGEGQAVERPPD